jgi:endonuclease/exonuclease/phosphatase (EEP) superfamily protein YafD
MRSPQKRRGWAAFAAGAAAPWAWFAVRDLSATFDEIAFFLPGIVLVALVCLAAVAVRKRKPALSIVAVSLIVFASVVVLEPRAPLGGPEPVDAIHIVSANAYEHNANPAEGSQDLLDRHPDVLVAVETTAAFRAGLAPALPYVVIREMNAVYSTWPLTLLPNPEALPDPQVIRVQVAAPSGPFVLYAVHPDNPLHETSFGGALALVEHLTAAADSEQLPVVLAGDFNETDRSQAYRTLASSFRDAMRTGWAGSTYTKGLFRLFQLRIDHVFTSTAWCAADAATFSVTGSDHEALEADVGPCPVATPGS